MNLDLLKNDFLNLVLPAHVAAVFVVKMVSYFSASYWMANAVSIPYIEFFTGLIYLLPWTLAVYFIARFALEDMTDWKWFISGCTVEILSKLFQVVFMGLSIDPGRITVVPMAFLGLILTQYAFLFGIGSQLLTYYQSK